MGADAAAYSDAEKTTTETSIMGDVAAKVHAKKGLGKRSALVAHYRDADAAGVAATPKGCSNACKICSQIPLPVVDGVAQAKEP